MSDHRLVTAYLRSLRRAAKHAPVGPRESLLEDVAAHLRATVPPNATDGHARRLLVEFGSPVDLVLEAFGAASATSTVRERRWWLLGGGVVLVVGVGVVLVRIGSGDPGTVTAEWSSALQVGPRTTEGRVYAEYVRETQSLPALPRGAEYPDGVPAEPDAGERVVAETGIGAVVADLTWLCLWESEYLDAQDAGAFERVLDAERALRSWRDVAPLSPAEVEGWAGNVLVPLQFDDPDGVLADRAGVCGGVGIIVP